MTESHAAGMSHEGALQHVAVNRGRRLHVYVPFCGNVVRVTYENLTAMSSAASMALDEAVGINPKPTQETP